MLRFEDTKDIDMQLHMNRSERGISNLIFNCLRESGSYKSGGYIY